MRVLNSTTVGSSPTTLRQDWWSAGVGPHEQHEQAGPTGPVPAWAEYIERSTSCRSSRPSAVATDPAVGDWQRALARCLEPLLASARRDLAEAGQTGPLTEEFLERLGLRLVRLATRTLVLELSRARDRGLLTGSTPAERFIDFTHRLVGGSELADFLAAYPVLARVLGEACRQATEGHLELLARLARDRGRLTGSLLTGPDPGALVSVVPGGDPHRGGRCTATLTFADGRRLVYKPRPLDLHGHFNDLVEWLNQRTGLGLQTVRLLRRPEYGWMQYIEHRPCDDLASVRRFYHRQGALLALLYVLDGTDMHYENLIADGDQPVLVDVETLFHPSPRPAGVLGQDPAQAALTNSVYRTALLPLLVSGEHGVVDVSGLGGDAGSVMPTSMVDWVDAGLDSMRLVRRPGRAPQGRNRPRLHGIDAEPRDHETALLAGFRAGYEAIAQDRQELLGPDGMLARFAGDEIRYVARPTKIYVSLLDESTHPDALRDAAGRSRLLDLLWDGDELQRRLVPHELADLWAGDVPLFTTRPESRDVWAADGSRVPDLLATGGLSAVEAKVTGLSEIDQHRQEWLISACLATRPQPVVHSGTATRPGLGATEADPEHLLAAATGIADELVAQVLGSSGPANWLGLELLDDEYWAVMPMGAGLSNGYTGTALFLAQVAQLTEADKYRELARDALRPMPHLLAALAADRESAQVVGPGLHGLGGICYALSRLSTLLGDAELLRWLDLGLELADGLTPEPDLFPGYTEGEAGGLAAMIAICADHEVPAASRLAVRYADRLVAAVDAGVHNAGPSSPGGFARGYQGVAWVLAQYAGPVDKYRDAALTAVDLDRQSGTVADPGWCSGDAGTALARLVTGAPADLDSYLATAADRQVLADLSLCHGELGAVEPLVWLADRRHADAEVVRRRRAGLALASVRQYGPQCGTPRGVPSPGLLTGLAGIGYGLLRLGFSARVPSVLLMEPTTGRWDRR